MKKKGFTLIELLIVIAIIGLLATLGIVSMSSARAKARDAKRISDLGQIRSAMELHFNDNGTYKLEDCSKEEEPVLIQSCPDDGITYIDWSEFKDPRGSKEHPDGEPCDGQSEDDVDSCNYAWTEFPNSTDYEVCAFLEEESDKFPDQEGGGYYISMNPDGFTAGCPGEGAEENE